MRKSLLLALFSFAVLAVAAEDYKQLLDSARKAESEKKQNQAIELYTRAAVCAQKPADQYNAIQKAARLLTRSKRQSEARKMLLEFAERESNPKGTRVMAYLESIRTTDAVAEKIRLLDAGIALQAGDWMEAACYNEKGALLFARKLYEQAAAEYQKVAGQRGYPVISRINSYLGLAKVAIQQKDYAAAHRHYQAILDFSKKDPKFVSLDAMKGEAALLYTEGKFDEGNQISLSIASNVKFSAKEREKALEQLMETEYNRRNDPVAARRMLEATAHLGIKHSYRVAKIAEDIKFLFDEE